MSLTFRQLLPLVPLFLLGPLAAASPRPDSAFSRQGTAVPSDPLRSSLDATSLFKRATCTGSQESCVSTGSSCCVNTPGGLLLQTQFWDTNPVTGPDDSWTIHGLWPDNCDGTFQENCDSSRNYSNLTSILSKSAPSVLSFMQEYWLSNDSSDESFWEHEWSTHGTCISTLEPSCYTGYTTGKEAVDFFTTTTNLFKTLSTYDFLAASGITPSSSASYTLSQLNAAAKAGYGKGVTPLFNCQGSNLDEVWWFFHSTGPISSGTSVFKPINAVGSSSCPSSGIKYLPKSGSGSTGGGGGGGGGGSGPTSGSKGTLQVVNGGAAKGCILSFGTWSVQTCATFTATTSGSGYTLKGSRGTCVVSGGVLDCTSTSTSVFTFASDGTMSYQGVSSFSAPGVPSGSVQETVSTSSGSQKITIIWTPS